MDITWKQAIVRHKTFYYGFPKTIVFIIIIQADARYENKTS